VTEVPAAAIVVAEILILGGGAFARYALHEPLTWTDELASILFLWLAMLGSCIALRRAAHMHLTTFIKDLPANKRAWVDAFGMCLVVGFLLMLAGPAWEHWHEEMEVSTPVLGLSEGWRAGAVCAGAFLMLVTAVARLVEHASWKQIAVAVAVVAEPSSAAAVANFARSATST
jgi:TRAP-type C4-dicarboxylate transport system permease small subunit